MALGKYFVPRRYVSYIKRIMALRAYDVDSIHLAEREKFQALGLDYDAGLSRLNEALSKLSNAPFDHRDGTDSIHWLLFSCLSVSDRAATIKRILEIGTFRAKTTVLLADLFPHSQIVTCDLPDHDPILTSTYRRETEEKLLEYKAKRDARLNNPNITFVQQNSFFLPSTTKEQFDLIWVDGGHLYPEVAWDVCNAWHMSTAGGMLMCDDIFQHPKGGDNQYGNADGFAVLNYIQVRTNCEISYFLKRENPIWSADALQRKHVAIVTKPKA